MIQSELVKTFYLFSISKHFTQLKIDSGGNDDASSIIYNYALKKIMTLNFIKSIILNRDLNEFDMQLLLGFRIMHDEIDSNGN